MLFDQSKLTGDVTGLRVGLLTEGFEGCESDVDTIVRRAAMSLVQLGVSVKEFSFPMHNQGALIEFPVSLYACSRMRGILIY